MFKARLTAPAVNNKYYVSSKYGGNNNCLIINKDTGSVLPNCVGYAWGRFLEESNKTTCDLSTGNAGTWYNHNDKYPRGQVPKLGAIMCWNGGTNNNGHVAVVEEIHLDGTVVCSNSGYYSKNRFFLETVKPPYNLNGLSFQGFIYNPYIDDEKPTYKMHGCDVSEHNSLDTDISTYDYVIIRATWGDHTDSKYEQWVDKCNQLNKPYGVYCYGYSVNTEEAKGEANYLLSVIKDKNIQVGVWYDYENDSWKENHNCTTPQQWTDICNTFCQIIQDEGYYTGIYSSQSYFDTHIHTTKWDRWVANWGNNDGSINADTESMGTMLQYTSNGNLDKNITYVDLSHYKSYPIENTTTENIEEIKPIETPIENNEVIPMPNDDYLFKMSNKMYDLLKFLTHIIPILITFYIALSDTWHLPYSKEIIASITAFDSMLIAIMNMSTIGYKGSK